jgi:hypothetical protein
MAAEKTVARRLQDETGAAYMTCLGRVRACKAEAEGEHVGATGFMETWLRVARKYVRVAPPTNT